MTAGPTWIAAREAARRLLAAGQPRLAAQSLWQAGSAALDAGEATVARELFVELHALMPNDAAVNLKLAVAALLAGDVRLAQQSAMAVIAVQPEQALAHCALGLAYARMERLDEAVTCLERAVALQPSLPEAHNGLGNAFSRLGRHADSVRHYRLALAQRPAFAECHANLADDLLQLGDLAGAEAAYRTALRHDAELPLAHVGLGGCLLRRGDYGQAWKELEWRAGLLGHRPYYRVPGGAIAPGVTLPRPSTWVADLDQVARLGVFAEQGLGDTLFYLRFLPCVAARVASVTVHLPPPLQRLVTWLAPLPRNVVFVGADTAPDADFICATGELPLVAGHTDDRPSSLTLAVPDDARRLAVSRLAATAPGPWLAIAWRAGLVGDATRRKEVPLSMLAEVLATWPGQVAVVQREPRAEELALLSAVLGPRMLDLSDLNDDLPMMAACLSVMDEFISVSATNVHVAAALGRPMRVLVRAAAEWRWHGTAPRSEWFDTAIVYRESRDAGWAPALAALSTDLHGAASAMRTARSA